jgi:Ser/Thr protein kinase RdoA (MazF antagonist)
MQLKSFEYLSPDIMIGAVEEACGRKMTGLAAPLPSYINRVYEFESTERQRYIAKFYRPGRWTYEALCEEHDFVLECAACDIPVIAPLKLVDGGTLGYVDGFYFAVYPKRFGREMEIKCDEDWRRIGSLLARVHNVGASREAIHRIMHHPLESTGEEIGWLRDGNYVTPIHEQEFFELAEELMEMIIPLFDDIEYIRIHGDSHRANVLERPGEGLMLIDFDDMMLGPPVQDIWLLLPEHANESQLEIALILEGYRMLRDFDAATLQLIEPLRAMRMIYFLAWIGKQTKDYNFESHFSGWGTDAFWRREIADLRNQCHIIQKQLR